MATVSKRAVKRGKAKVEKVAEKKAATFDLNKVKRDKVINGAFSVYERSEKAPSSLMTLMDSIVRHWAKSSYSDSPKYGEYLQSREAVIRMAVRREQKGKVTARDKKGVAASQFNSALKLAKMKGGLAAWDMIVARTSNWTNAKELSVKVREYHKAHNESFPKGAAMDSILAKVKREKYGTRSGKNDGTSNSSVKTLLTRMQATFKKLRPKVRSFDVAKQMTAIADALGAITLATATAKGTGARKVVKLKGDQVIAFEKFLAAQKRRAA